MAVGPGTPGSPPGGMASSDSVIPHHEEKGLTVSYVKTRTALRKTAASEARFSKSPAQTSGRRVMCSEDLGPEPLCALPSAQKVLEPAPSKPRPP